MPPRSQYQRKLHRRQVRRSNSNKMSEKTLDDHRFRRRMGHSHSSKCFWWQNWRKIPCEGNLKIKILKISLQIAKVNRENYEVYPIIVRPNEYHDLEDDFIENELASKPENYKKVFTGRFDIEMKQALEEIIREFR